MNGYSLQNAHPDVGLFLQNLTQAIISAFPGKIISIILHGSLAMGSFYPPKSDIDILVITKFLDKNEREKMFDLLQQLHAKRPYVGGLEVSVILANNALHPQHPLPYLVHFSETTSEQKKFEDDNLPADEDLLAHLMVARTHGISLYGINPKEIIGEINWSEYVNSVQADIDWILDGENILSSPFYCILNLCRYLMMEQSLEPIVPSKEEGGRWAIDSVPEDLKPMIQKALEAYQSNLPVKDAEERRVAGMTWDKESLLSFRDAFKKLISI